MIVFKILNYLDLSKGKEIVSNFSAKGKETEKAVDILKRSIYSLGTKAQWALYC